MYILSASISLKLFFISEFYKQFTKFIIIYEKVFENYYGDVKLVTFETLFSDNTGAKYYVLLLYILLLYCKILVKVRHRWANRLIEIDLLLSRKAFNLLKETKNQIEKNNLRNTWAISFSSLLNHY